jgi:hypothetical protein
MRKDKDTTHLAGVGAWSFDLPSIGVYMRSRASYRKATKRGFLGIRLEAEVLNTTRILITSAQR